MRLKFKELQISDSVCPITRNALLAKLFGEPLKE